MRTSRSGSASVCAQLPKPFRRPRPRAVPLRGATTGQRGHCPEVVSNAPQRLRAETQREALVIVAVARVRVGLPDESGEVGRTAVDRVQEGLGLPDHRAREAARRPRASARR